MLLPLGANFIIGYCPCPLPFLIVIKVFEALDFRSLKFLRINLLQNSVRPGAVSDTVFIADAITDTCRVTGLSTAEEIRIREVAWAAIAMLTKTSRSSI